MAGLKEDDPNAPWKRLPDETDKAWEAFQIYRDYGPARSQSKVAGLVGKSANVIGRWATKYNWVWRVHQFDRYLDEKRVEAQVTEVQKMSERHARQAQAITSALMVPVTALLQRLERDKSALEQLGDEDLVELILLCSRMSTTFPSIVNVERLARGEATEIVRQLEQEGGGDAVFEKIMYYRAVFDKLSAEAPAIDGDVEGDSVGEPVDTP